MPKKPNYSFEKRQKELQKKAKKEEKRLRKLRGEEGEGDAAQDPEASEGGEVATS
ncbi:MAG: hypothetical protein WD928_14270 [Gammaproteobacteria bacterium]